MVLEDRKVIRNFTNYFGMGTDARISYLAQKLNAHGVWMKKFAYGIAGFCSFFLQWGSLAKKFILRERTHKNRYNCLGELKTMPSIE